MSRDDGFTVADVDSAYLDDAKMRQLWQRLQDADRMARAVVLHSATLLASWRHGERIRVMQAAPIWLPADDALVAALKAVKLLDRAGKIPEASWDQWFGAAWQRREARREIGRAGGRASGKRRATVSEPTVQRQSSASEPVRTDRTDPSVDTPQPPSRGGRRAEGTNYRAYAAEISRLNEEAARERKARRVFRQRAYLDGRITEAQRADMDDRDAPLTEIPTQRGAAYAQA
jgi:hypothetical protein